MAQNQQPEQSLRKGASAPIKGASTWSQIQDASVEIRNTYGFMPEFVSSMPEKSIPGAWSEVKNFFYNPNTALTVQIKDVIGYSVSTQIPCDLLNYLNKAMCVTDGVSPQEQSEALLMGAITRHWSTFLNGLQLDKNEFHQEVNHVMSYVAKSMEESEGRLPPEEFFLVNFSTVDETLKDIENTLGLVPKFLQSFPAEGLPGAWSEFKAIQLNPHTALSGKHKELIGLAVASQIPCDYCIYFHRNAAVLNGASEREIREAIAVSSMSRHWSAVFHSAYFSLDEFRPEADKLARSSRPQLHS